MINYVEKLNEKMFEDVIAFSVSESNAIYPNNMTFYRKNGESFSVDCHSKKTLYSTLEKLFPVLENCHWDGPKIEEESWFWTYILGEDGKKIGTTVPETWWHSYLEGGNHLVVKMEYVSTALNILLGKSNDKIVLEWVKMFNKSDFPHLVQKTDAFLAERKSKQQQLINALTELKNNAEFVRRIKEARREPNAMMAILGEFSGIKTSWEEFKGFMWDFVE